MDERLHNLGVVIHIAQQHGLVADRYTCISQSKGRVTKGACLSLLGKAYLYQNKFDQAASTLDQVIDQNQYELISEYNDLFKVNNEGHSESVFDVQYSGAEGGG